MYLTGMSQPCECKYTVRVGVVPEHREMGGPYESVTTEGFKKAVSRGK